jgi:hypothetical protein
VLLPSCHKQLLVLSLYHSEWYKKRRADQVMSSSIDSMPEFALVTESRWPFVAARDDDFVAALVQFLGRSAAYSGAAARNEYGVS